MAAANSTTSTVQARESSIYSPADHQAISQQINKRWLFIGIPCALLAAVLVISLIIRLEWLTICSSVAIGAVLIAAYDLTLRPLVCYRRHLNNVLYGRAREATLPFVALSEDVNLVDGVSYRAMTCSDIDGKGRPYDRLFYFDALKPFPDVKEGDMLRVVHHDLVVADITRA